MYNVQCAWYTSMQQDDSLKETTREKRGKGVRRKVFPGTKIPSNFSSFLHGNKNKEELFALLTNDVSVYDYRPEKEVYITSNTSVIYKCHSEPMPESDHEEADTRMCLHVSDAIRKGARYVLVRTVDTDVIVILVGVFFELLKLNPNVQIWVVFGRGKNFKHYYIRHSLF